MSILEFLDNLLINQRIPDNFKKEMDNDRTKIEQTINQIPDLSSPTYYYGGSRGKKTMIKESYDLDLVIYFPATTKFSINEIYEYVTRYMGSSNYDVYPKNVSIRVLKRSNYHIDLVPGKRIIGSESEAFLWKAKKNQRLKTSITTHIDTIKNFGRRDVIKLLKLWKVRNNIEFPSFILEQIIIRGLNDCLDLPLDEAIIHSLNYIAKNIETIRLVDPANSNNILTEEDVISTYSKSLISKATQQSLSANDLSKLEGWKNLFEPKSSFDPYKSDTGVKGRIKPDAPDTRWGYKLKN